MPEDYKIRLVVTFDSHTLNYYVRWGKVNKKENKRIRKTHTHINCKKNKSIK